MMSYQQVRNDLILINVIMQTQCILDTDVVHPVISRVRKYTYSSDGSVEGQQTVDTITDSVEARG